MVEHVSISDPDVHEPKGASAAATKTAYISDGAGSGSWRRPPYMLCGEIADVSTAGSVYVPVPITGTITFWTTCLQGAITGADANLKLQINAVDVTGSGIVVANAGSASGDVDSANPTAANSVTAGQAIRVVTDGASTGAIAVQFVIFVEPQ